MQQHKRSPVPKPTIRHPDRKKEADRTACRGSVNMPWLALVVERDKKVASAVERIFAEYWNALGALADKTINNATTNHK